MPDQEINSQSLRNLLHCIFKRKWTFIVFFCTTFLTVALGTFLAKPSFEATAQILVKIGRENLFLPTVGNVGPVVGLNREEQINSEIEILKARSLIQKVVETIGPANIYPDLGIQKRQFRVTPSEGGPENSMVQAATMAILKSLSVERIKKSNVIVILFTHEDPQMAALVVNTLANLFLDRHLEIHKTKQAYQFFSTQSQALKEKLAQSEEALKEFMARHNISSFADEQRLLLNQAAELRMSLNQLQGQIAEIEGRIPMLREQLSKTPAVIMQREDKEHNPYTINTLMTKLVELESKEKELLKKYTEENRLVLDIKKEIQRIREDLSYQEEKLFKKSSHGPNPIYQRLREDLLKSETDLTALRPKREKQLAQLEDYQKRLTVLNRAEMELNQLRNEVESNRQNHQLYLTKFEESRISDAMDSEKIANVMLTEPAHPPFKPVSPKVVLNIFLGAFLGIFGGLLTSLFMEYLDDSLERPEDVERFLHLPVLGSIPEIRP